MADATLSTRFKVTRRRGTSVLGGRWALRKPTHPNKLRNSIPDILTAMQLRLGWFKKTNVQPGIIHRATAAIHILRVGYAILPVSVGPQPRTAPTAAAAPPPPPARPPARPRRRGHAARRRRRTAAAGRRAARAPAARKRARAPARRPPPRRGPPRADPAAAAPAPLARRARLISGPEIPAVRRATH